jgi:hypothetical protein
MLDKPLSNGDLLMQIRDLLFREAIEGRALSLEDSPSANQAIIRGILAQNPNSIRRELIDAELHRDALFRIVHQEEIEEYPELNIITISDDEDGTFSNLAPIINLSTLED